MHLNTCAACAVCAASLSLVACSTAGSVASTPTPTVAGRLFTGQGFDSAVPEGWINQTGNNAATALVSANGQVLMLVQAAGGDTGIRAHIDVTESGQPVPDDQLSAYLLNAGRSGASNISRPQSFSVDAAKGVFVTYTLSGAGVVLEEKEMVVNHMGNTFDIVLNAPRSEFGADLSALQTVVHAWVWTS